jgi:hypothetical protein
MDMEAIDLTQEDESNSPPAKARLPSCAATPALDCLDLTMNSPVVLMTSPAKRGARGRYSTPLSCRTISPASQERRPQRVLRPRGLSAAVGKRGEDDLSSQDGRGSEEEEEAGWSAAPMSDGEEALDALDPGAHSGEEEEDSADASASASFSSVSAGPAGEMEGACEARGPTAEGLAEAREVDLGWQAYPRPRPGSFSRGCGRRGWCPSGASR